MSNNSEVVLPLGNSPVIKSEVKDTEVVTTVKVTPVAGVKLIKRYNNRKLYDTETSSYITLKEVYGYVKSGETIQIMNHNGSDITSSVFLTALVEECRELNNNEIANLLEFAINYFRGGLDEQN